MTERRVKRSHEPGCLHDEPGVTICTRNYLWMGYGQDVDDIVEAVDLDGIESTLLVLVPWDQWYAMRHAALTRGGPHADQDPQRDP